MSWNGFDVNNYPRLSLSVTSFEVKFGVTKNPETAISRF
jgi:hypothetical protein